MDVDILAGYAMSHNNKGTQRKTRKEQQKSARKRKRKKYRNDFQTFFHQIIYLSLYLSTAYRIPYIYWSPFDPQQFIKLFIKPTRPWRLTVKTLGNLNLVIAFPQPGRCLSQGLIICHNLVKLFENLIQPNPAQKTCNCKCSCQRTIFRRDINHAVNSKDQTSGQNVWTAPFLQFQYFLSKIDMGSGYI